MFHRQIDEKNKERLEVLMERIKTNLENEGFESKRHLRERRAMGGDFRALNQVKLYFIKENVNYLITIEVLE